MTTGLNERLPSPIAWTPETLAWALTQTAEDVIMRHGVWYALSYERWRWISVAHCLHWRHGFDGALARLCASPEPEARAA